MHDVRRFATADELIQASARQFAETAQKTVDERDYCTVALAGGNTPRRLYEALVGEPLPWNRMLFFFGDERLVPPDHPESNYHMAHEAWLARVPIPPRNIHRVPTELPDPALVAQTYETTLASRFDLRRRRWPRFDLVLLGLGADGHTASLFPGTPVLEERERMVAATYVETLKSARVTLTYPVFNASTFVMFVVSGVEKAEALKATLEGGNAAEPTPARRIKPIVGRVVWMVDEAAASMLSA
jgi:6-phosphogluconolactonase